MSEEQGPGGGRQGPPSRPGPETLLHPALAKALEELQATVKAAFGAQ